MGVSLKVLRLNASNSRAEIIESPPGYVINFTSEGALYNAVSIIITPEQALSLLEDLILYFSEDAWKMLTAVENDG